MTRAEDAIDAIAGELLSAGHDRAREIASDLRDAAGALSKAASLMEVRLGDAGPRTADPSDYLLVAMVCETVEERQVSYLDACGLHKVEVNEFRRALGAVARSSAEAEAANRALAA